MNILDRIRGIITEGRNRFLANSDSSIQKTYSHSDSVTDFDFKNAHRVRFLKGTVLADINRTRVWINWCLEHVDDDEWRCLSNADPTTHDFFFNKSDDAAIFKLTFSGT